MKKNKKVIFLITDAGGGHRGSAESLQACLLHRVPGLQVKIVNVYKDIWPDHEPFKRVSGIYAEDFYNWVLRKNLIFLTPLMRVLAMRAGQRFSDEAIRVGAEFLAAEKADLAISFMPFANSAFAQMCRHAALPLALVVTDLIDTRPYMWFQQGAADSCLFTAVSCNEAANQALEAGFRGAVIKSGLVIHPKYAHAEVQKASRIEARKKLNLDLTPLTITVVMGGAGGNAVHQWVEALAKCEGNWQVVACCGKNAQLYWQIKTLSKNYLHKLVPMGFREDMQWLLRASDMVITKPGPATITEAIAMGCPLVLDTRKTMIQEIPNIAWSRKMGIARDCKGPSGGVTLVSQLARDLGQRLEMEKAMRTLNVHQAGQKISDAVERVLEEPRQVAA